MKIFQRTYTKPLPKGAKIMKRRGGKVAQFYGPHGRVMEAKLTASGDRVLCTSDTWFVAYEDGNGITHTVKGFKEEGPTKTLADKMQKLADFKGAGDHVDGDLRTWLAGLPAAVRADLVRVGLIEPDKPKPQPQALLLADMLTAFERYLRLEREKSPKYIKGTVSQLKRSLDGCQFVAWDDIDHEKLKAWLLDQRDAGKGISKRTYNAFVQSLKYFCEWAVDAYDSIQASPLRKLERLENEGTDRRRVRRAANADEARKLLEATMAGPEREGMEGPERALLYRFILETGLRAGECRSLIVSDLQVEDPKNAVVVVRAVNSKRREEDQVPLRPPLAAALQSFILQRRKLPGARVFCGRFKRLSDHVCEALQEDLQAAGLPYRDEEGKYFDLHSGRYTFVTRLGKSGLDVDTVRKLARHSSVVVTQKYMDTEDREKRAGVEHLPDYDLPSAESAAAAKTGTDGRP